LLPLPLSLLLIASLVLRRSRQLHLLLCRKVSFPRTVAPGPAWRPLPNIPFHRLRGTPAAAPCSHMRKSEYIAAKWRALNCYLARGKVPMASRNGSAFCPSVHSRGQGRKRRRLSSILNPGQFVCVIFSLVFIVGCLPMNGESSQRPRSQLTFA
jgi:hypothetical protein